MRKIILLFTLVMLMGSLQAQRLQANLSYAKFYHPELGSYIETYLSVDAAGVDLVEIKKGEYQAKVNLLLMFKRNDSIIDYSKTQLSSPVITDTLAVHFNFLDQQRFFLPNGGYTLEIEFQDASKDADPSISSTNIDLYFTDDKVQLSDVELLSSYEKSTEWKVNTKNGFDMIPYNSTFFPETVDKITYYAEIYNVAKVLGEKEKFLLTAFISNENDDQPIKSLVIRRRMDAQEVNVILSQFDLSKLASGNYYLNIEIRNRNNEVLTGNKSFFQVSNPSVIFDNNILAKIEAGNSFVTKFSEDSLNYLIKSFMPIANGIEKSFITNSLGNVSKEQKQKFMAFFWDSRDEVNPEHAWKKYHVEVLKTNRSFGNKYEPGYTTDRGRVYLQFGEPNTISDQSFETGGGRHDGSVPYQIWHYYNIGNQRDGKFVFYNPHLIPNGYTLLHSNVIGEVNNPHWQVYLRRNQLESIDASEYDVYGGRSGELYNNPR